VIADSLRAAGIVVESKAEMYRFGELDVPRVRRILAGDVTSRVGGPRRQAARVVPGMPVSHVYATLKSTTASSPATIGCYTLGVLPPYQAVDTCVAMGASIGVGLGLRHVLPDEEARRVVSVIRRLHVRPLASAAWSRWPTTRRDRHVVLVLDNGTTAMTGQQEHPGTGRTLDHMPTGKLSIEGVASAIGIGSVTVIDPMPDAEGFERLLIERLGGARAFGHRCPAAVASWRRPTFGNGSSRRPSLSEGLRRRRPSTSRRKER